MRSVRVLTWVPVFATLISLAATAGTSAGAAAVPLDTGLGIHQQTAFRAQAASALLTQLRVAPETNAGTYDRDYFGSWSDADRDKCNTRKEVLIAESTTPVTLTGTCTIEGGTWRSPYDNSQTSNPASYDIDHMVPLKEAWVSGAHGWNQKTLRTYANDLGYEYSLIAVSAKSNRQKSDQDPAEWMPSNSAYVCEYVGQWVAIKYRWSLAVDPAEHSVLSGALSSCSSAADVVTPALATIVAGDLAVTARPPASTPNNDATSPSEVGTGQQFQNCAALNATYPGGIASTPESVNLVSGTPRATKNALTVDAAIYAANTRLDRDKDGVACER